MKGCDLNGRSDPRAILLDVIVPIFVCGKAKFIHPVRWTPVTKSVLNVTILSMSETSAYGI